jgi:alpha-1,6-mannosyltransferase
LTEQVSVAAPTREKLSTFARLALIGVASLFPYAYALGLKNLLLNIVPFEWAFFVAFGLYALATWWVLQNQAVPTRRMLVLIFAFAIFFRVILIFSQPALSDDMYRYVWDGRVQAHGINPYVYPPDAAQVAGLRDSVIWPRVGWKPYPTIYPAGAELVFAAAWRIWPDNVHWFQAIMVAADLLAGVLLVFLLRALGRSPLAVLIYLWNPLVIFEMAQAAHVDALVLPLLVAALLARVGDENHPQGRPALSGVLLGLAASIKLFPVLLLPALWHWKDERGRNRPAWVMPLAFLAAFGLTYLPYLSIGTAVLGFLPVYFHQAFNFLTAVPIYILVFQAGGSPELVINALIMAVLLAIYLFFLFCPAADAETALRRCLWPIGAYTLLTINLYPWYLLWLVPFLTLFLASRQAGAGGEPTQLAWRLLSSSWTGWWLLSGLIALAYTFYIRRLPDWVAILVQFIPLYEFLLIDLARWLKINISLHHTRRHAA